MFARSAALHILALVVGALFLHTASAVSPCPDITNYNLVVDNNSPTGCECQNTTPGNGEPNNEDASAACTYTQNQDNSCTATCPTGSRRRRSEPKIYLNVDRSIINCAEGLTSCPITTSALSYHECVNTLTDLDNCGGCAALDQGQICGKQAGVRTASCNKGICQAHSCRSGYTLDTNTGKCTRAD